MKTLDLLKIDYAAVIEKLGRGEVLTKQEREILRIGKPLFGGQARNAGKGNGSSNIQKVR